MFGDSEFVRTILAGLVSLPLPDELFRSRMEQMAHGVRAHRRPAQQPRNVLSIMCDRTGLLFNTRLLGALQFPHDDVGPLGCPGEVSRSCGAPSVQGMQP